MSSRDSVRQASTPDTLTAFAYIVTRVLRHLTRAARLCVSPDQAAAVLDESQACLQRDAVTLAARRKAAVAVKREARARFPGNFVATLPAHAPALNLSAPPPTQLQKWQRDCPVTWPVGSLGVQAMRYRSFAAATETELATTAPRAD